MDKKTELEEVKERVKKAPLNFLIRRYTGNHSSGSENAYSAAAPDLRKPTPIIKPQET